MTDPAASGPRETAEIPVTVLIPTFDRADLLPRALRSIEAQRGVRPAEVLVVDDGSSDSSAEVAEQHALAPRVIRHAKNRGLSAARNTGLREARNEWIALLDSDDEWLPDHLARVWAIRDDNVLVGGSMIMTSPNWQYVVYSGPLSPGERRLESPIQLLHPINYLPASATILRRDVAVEAGGFRAHDGVAEDLDLWTRMLERGKGKVSADVTLLHHRHKHQLSADAYHILDAHLTLISHYRDRDWWSPGLLRRQEGAVAWYHLRLGVGQGWTRALGGFVARMLSHPQRALGASAAARRQLRNSRVSSRIAPDGQASLALLVSSTRHDAALRALGWAPTADLSSTSTARALLRLCLRPSAAALVRTRFQAFALRIAGIHAATDPGGLPPRT